MATGANRERDSSVDVGATVGSIDMATSWLLVVSIIFGALGLARGILWTSPKKRSVRTEEVNTDDQYRQ